MLSKIFCLSLRKDSACARIELLNKQTSRAQSLSGSRIITRSAPCCQERRLGIMEVYGVIYLLINAINDMEYIGQTTRSVEERFKEHKKRKKYYIGNAIRKHGAENFVIAILKVCYSKAELDFWEKHFIKSRDTMVPNGYNCTEGGEGVSGWKHTEETKAQIAASLSGENHPSFGKPFSDEHCKKLALKKLGNKLWLGKHHSCIWYRQIWTNALEG